MEMQRSLARRNSVVMDGRDIGTVVLPDASVKIFLTADPRERARRRHAELREKGSSVTLDEVLRDMQERDERDSRRAAAPLRAAEDAVVLDTTGLSLEEAYYAAHHRELGQRLAQASLESAVQAVSAGRARPRELRGGQSASIGGNDPRQMTREQREELKKRIYQARAQGKKLPYGS